MRVVVQVQVVVAVLLPVLAAFPVLVVYPVDTVDEVSLWRVADPLADGTVARPLLAAVLVLAVTLLGQGASERAWRWWAGPSVLATIAALILLAAGTSGGEELDYGGDALLVAVLAGGLATAVRLLTPERSPAELSR
jgi:peptidoglycan/LPS O-acetylase OafA/YrhL